MVLEEALEVLVEAPEAREVPEVSQLEVEVAPISQPLIEEVRQEPPMELEMPQAPEIQISQEPETISVQT